MLLSTVFMHVFENFLFFSKFVFLARARRSANRNTPPVASRTMTTASALMTLSPTLPCLPFNENRTPLFAAKNTPLFSARNNAFS